MTRREKNTGSISWNGNINGFYFRKPMKDNKQENIAKIILVENETSDELRAFANELLDIFNETGKWASDRVEVLDNKEEISDIEEINNYELRLYQLENELKAVRKINQELLSKLE